MIKVNEDVCIGCAACTSLADRTFKMNEAGKAEVINQEITQEARDAKDSCPVSAIELD